MKLKKLWMLPILALALSPKADALVAVGNGNYFVGFVHMEHDAPLNTFQLKVQCTYNSRSQYDGICGYGWGSDFEAFLVPSSDGSVVIQESGGGDKTRFSPKDFSKADLEKQVDRLVEAYAKKMKLSVSQAKEWKTKFLNNAEERDEKS